MSEAATTADRDVTDRLAAVVLGNLGLVGHVVDHFQGRGVSRDDLMQAGAIGLIRADAKFRPGGEGTFATYAYHWIRKEIREAIGNTSRPIRLPIYLHKYVARYHRAARDLAAAGAAPSPDAVLDAIGVSGGARRHVLEAVRLSAAEVGHQSPEWFDAHVARPERLEMEEAADERDLVEGVLAGLPDRDREFVILTYGLDGGPPLDCRAVAERYGICKSAVAKAVGRALARLRREFAGEDVPARPAAPRTPGDGLARWAEAARARRGAPPEGPEAAAGRPPTACVPRTRAARPLMERLMARVEVVEGGCWTWGGCVTGNGYGQITRGRAGVGTVAVHRASYEHHLGPIPAEGRVAQTCGEPRCVNPAHLELITHAEGILRGAARAAEVRRPGACGRGHEANDENTRANARGDRACRACDALRARERRERGSRDDPSSQAQETCP